MHTMQRLQGASDRGREHARKALQERNHECTFKPAIIGLPEQCAGHCALALRSARTFTRVALSRASLSVRRYGSGAALSGSMSQRLHAWEERKRVRTVGSLPCAAGCVSGREALSGRVQAEKERRLRMIEEKERAECRWPHSILAHAPQSPP